MPNKLIQTECTICRDWKDRDTHRFYTPTAEARRNYHFGTETPKLSHGFCPACYVLYLKQEGLPQEEVQGLVKAVYDEK